MQLKRELAQKRKKMIMYVVGVCAVLIVGLLLLRLTKLYSVINTQTSKWNKPVPKEKTVFSFLLMGYGGAGHEGAYLTDTMLVARVDTKKNNVIIISIPRDTWVKVPTESGEDFYRKINSVYQMGLFPKNFPDLAKKYQGDQGAAELIKKTVGSIVGFPIDYYAAVDFQGFKKSVDTLGGVDITVQKSFIDVEYPIDGKEEELCGVDPNDTAKIEELEKIATDSPELAYPCRYETLQFEAGRQHMDAETALKFVRSRHSLQDGGDFGRAARQQLFLQAVKDKVLSIGFLPKIIPLLNDLEDNVRLDVPLELVNRMIAEAPVSSKYEVNQLVLSTDNYLMNSHSTDGQYILTSDDGQDVWTTLHADVKKMIDGISLTPSPSPAPSRFITPISPTKKNEKNSGN